MWSYATRPCAQALTQQDAGSFKQTYHKRRKRQPCCWIPYLVNGQKRNLFPMPCNITLHVTSFSRHCIESFRIHSEGFQLFWRLTREKCPNSSVTNPICRNSFVVSLLWKQFCCAVSLLWEQSCYEFVVETVLLRVCSRNSACAAWAE